MLKHGTTSIGDIYKGLTKMGRVYKGTQLVYQSKRLPSGYVEVEYLESHGTEYIDTGYIPKTTNKFSIKFSLSSLLNQAIFGSRTSGTYDTSLDQIYLNNSGAAKLQLINRYASNDYVISNSTVVNQIYEVSKIQNENCQLDNPTQPLYIFAFNNLGNSSLNASAKIYYLKIYDNNTLVRDFIPAVRLADGEAGLYDLVNGVFYTNAGTGKFTYGKFKNIPSGYAQVDLGTLHFTYDSNYWIPSNKHRWYVNVSSTMKLPNSNNEVADIFCGNYITRSINDMHQTTGTGIGIATNGNLYVYNDSNSITPSGWLLYKKA